MAAVAVVGAGLAGLVAANHLKRRGIRVVVYEATDRAGGTIRSERRDEYLAELGPSALAAPSGAIADLITELALDGSRITAALEARRRYIVRKGRLVALPSSLSELLTTRLLSNGAKLAVFGEPLEEPGDSPVEESVAGFFRRRFNQEVVDYVANPFVAGHRGYIDDVIMPHETRGRICRSLAMLRNKKVENPWRKHGNIPL